MPNPARTNHGCSETCHSPMRGSGLYTVGPMSSMPRHGFATPLCWRRWVGVEHQAVKDKHDPTCARAALSAISGSLSAPCYDLLGPLNETHPMEYFSRLRPDSAAANPGLHGVGSTADLPLRAKAKMGGKLTKLSAPPGPMAPRALWVGDVPGSTAYPNAPPPPSGSASGQRGRSAGMIRASLPQ